MIYYIVYIHTGKLILLLFSVEAVMACACVCDTNADMCSKSLLLERDETDVCY
jgi:hypothetical protein